MSDVSRFLKKNKIQKPNGFYAATKSLTDEAGEPLRWEMKPLSSRENDEIQQACSVEVPLKGKPGQFRSTIDNARYIRKAIAASVVFPDLSDETLLKSYGALRPEDLIEEMVDDAGEWSAFILFFNKFNGFASLAEEIEEAKN
jgi:hypothetical protein